jgi:hypothetical protein
MISCSSITVAQNGLHLRMQMLMYLTLLLRNATTTMLALFPFLHLTFSLLCVVGRMWKTAKQLLARRYLCIFRSHSTSCASGYGISAFSATRPMSACVMFISCTTPNRCPCLMSALHCVATCRNATTRRGASIHVSLSPLPRQFGARWAAH